MESGPKCPCSTPKERRRKGEKGKSVKLKKKKVEPPETTARPCSSCSCKRGWTRTKQMGRKSGKTAGRSSEA